jgi:uncharacterized protein (DUF885 family)
MSMKLALMALLLVSALPAQQRNIDDFFRDFTAEWVRGDPNLAISSRYFTGEEQDQLDRHLTPLTDAYQRERVALAKRGLAELGEFGRSEMNSTQRLSIDTLRWQLEDIVAGEPYGDYSFPLEQFRGANSSLVSVLTRLHPLRTERDAENYLARLAQVGARMEEAIAEARRIEGRGMIPPRFILDATIQQMQRFADPSPGQNPFVTTLAEKMEAVPSLTSERRADLARRAAAIIVDQVYPAWKKAISLLQSQVPRSTNDAGIWRLKGGTEAYAYFLRHFTTTDLTADEIHEIGLRQVARIESEMDAILRQLGRAEGSVKERIEKLEADLRYPDPASEASRTKIIRDLDEIIHDAERRAATLFDIRPKSPVIVEPTPAFLEANAAANYSSPAPDGSRPGIYQHPRRPDRMTTFGLRSVAYHEAVPGHHFQLALQVEDRDLPRFRQIRAFGGISANAEGWGLYAERLAAESGWYDGDSYGLLGQLDAELFRARRLVVDTGLHAKRWTRQRAIDYGIPASEVERYVVLPGQACSYMIGQLKIIELREKARKALGGKFSIRVFHNVLLKAGMVPLDLLEREVDTYIQSEAAKL